MARSCRLGVGRFQCVRADCAIPTLSSPHSRLVSFRLAVMVSSRRLEKQSPRTAISLSSIPDPEWSPKGPRVGGHNDGSTRKHAFPGSDLVFGFLPDPVPS